MAGKYLSLLVHFTWSTTRREPWLETEMRDDLYSFIGGIMKNKKAINKVELLLPYLIAKLGDPIGPHKYKLHIRLSHQEVADLSGVTRETTTTLVKQLEKRGVIEQARGQWVIHTDKTEAGPFEDE